jgi:hypothetical protein
MKESAVTDSEDEYPDPTDDIEMDDDESVISHAGNTTPVPLFLPDFLTSELRNSDNSPFNPPLEIRPLPRRASNTQERRNDPGINDDGTSHQESITPAPQQHTAASAGTVVLFRSNPDSPLFKVGNKRPAQDEDEGHRRQKDEKRLHVRATQLCDTSVC